MVGGTICSVSDLEDTVDVVAPDEEPVTLSMEIRRSRGDTVRSGYFPGETVEKVNVIVLCSESIS